MRLCVDPLFVASNDPNDSESRANHCTDHSEKFNFANHRTNADANDCANDESDQNDQPIGNHRMISIWGLTLKSYTLGQGPVVLLVTH